MGNANHRGKGVSSARAVADVLRSRSRTAEAYTLRAPDGRLYCDFAGFLASIALKDCYVFTDREMAEEYRKMEKGSKIAPVKVRVEITVGKE